MPLASGFLTIPEAVQYTRVSARTLHNRVKEGVINAYAMPGDPRIKYYKQDELDTLRIPGPFDPK